MQYHKHLPIGFAKRYRSKGYFNEDKNIEFKSFDTYDALKESFNKDLDYIMVPKYELTSDILEKNYSVVYEFSDIKKYYGQKFSENKQKNMTI